MKNKKLTERIIEELNGLKGLNCSAIEVLWSHSFPDMAKLFFHYSLNSGKGEVQIRAEINPQEEAPIKLNPYLHFDCSNVSPLELTPALRDYDVLEQFIQEKYGSFVLARDSAGPGYVPKFVPPKKDKTK